MITPWGLSDDKQIYSEGIVFYETSCHGGFKVNKKQNMKIPEFMRDAGGWYEEDSEWAKVAVSFPEIFPLREFKLAEKILQYDEDIWNQYCKFKLSRN